MSKNTTVLQEQRFKNFFDNYKKNIVDIKNKSNNYLKNNNDKDFFEISTVLKKMRYDQLIFPNKIRKEKTLQEIRKALSPIFKTHEKLKACNIIDTEISKNKKIENGQTQTQTKNFDTYLKIKKQTLKAKINKILFGINSIQSPPLFDEGFHKISLENRAKNLNQKIDRLAKAIEKKIRIITSNGIVDDVVTLRKIKRLQNNFEKLQFALDIFPKDKEQIGNDVSDQHTTLLVKNLEKVQYLLNDIRSSSYTLKLLKYGNTDNHLVDITNKINKEFQNKQNQFIDTCKHLMDASP
jgi:hypothetical protein